MHARPSELSPDLGRVGTNPRRTAFEAVFPSVRHPVGATDSEDTFVVVGGTKLDLGPSVHHGEHLC